MKNEMKNKTKNEIIAKLAKMQAAHVAGHNEEFGGTWRGRICGIVVPMNFDDNPLFAKLNDKRVEILSCDGFFVEIKQGKNKATMSIPLNQLSSRVLKEICRRVEQQII
jgi:hypothetical protein